MPLRRPAHVQATKFLWWRQEAAPLLAALVSSHGNRPAPHSSAEDLAVHLLRGEPEAALDALARSKGFAHIRMEVGDDLALGAMLKQEGNRSTMLNGKGFVYVRAGVLGKRRGGTIWRGSFVQMSSSRRGCASSLLARASPRAMVSRRLASRRVA